MYHIFNTRTLQNMLYNAQHRLDILKNPEHRLVEYEIIKRIATELLNRWRKDMQDLH